MSSIKEELERWGMDDFWENLRKLDKRKTVKYGSYDERERDAQ
jgi:hypothetical protein